MCLVRNACENGIPIASLYQLTPTGSPTINRVAQVGRHAASAALITLARGVYWRKQLPY